ncbi:MAG: hypothetical protein KBC78_00640 [Candidatus Pacebacteria bacterium]|nr:hypothetical protein [Candidatus Paceibacterota bacterium]
MKKTLFITILLLLAIIVVGLVIWSDKQSVIEPVVDTNVATTSAISSVPSPLTLASLQALPDWNPTMEVEGMKRVEDGNPELEVKNLPIHTEEIRSNNSSSTFVIKYLEPEVSNEACEKYGLTGEPSGYLLRYNCLIATPDLFNELIVLSGNTGEVLHKYRLKEGYSLAGDVYRREGGIVTINNSVDKKIIGIYIYKWDFSSDVLERTPVLRDYRINLITGEITEIKPR